MSLALVLFALLILSQWPHHRRRLKTRLNPPTAQFSPSLVSAQPLSPPPSRAPASVDEAPVVADHPIPQAPPDIIGHENYETNDDNLNEIKKICKYRQAEDWTEACEQVARYFARNRSWDKANRYASKSCDAGLLAGCLLVSKIILKSTGSKELAFQKVEQGCQTWDGQAPALVEGIVFLDRLACKQLSVLTEPYEKWQALLQMDYGIDNHTFAKYFDENF